MDGDAGDLTSCIEAGQRCPLGINHNTGVHIRWNTAHRIVSGRLDGHWLRDWLDAQVVTGKVGDIGQLLGNLFRSEVAHVQVEVVFTIYAPALFDLLYHTTRDNIAWSQVFERGH